MSKHLEIEATFVEIDKEKLREKLKTLGAELVAPERLMRRVVFKLQEDCFIRVRDEGNRIVMTYKRHHSDTITGTEEINVEVSDYEDTIAILKAGGLEPKSDEDSYRESWTLGGVEIDIDTWPWIPTYVEIEGETPEKVAEVAEKLGFKMGDAIYGSVDAVYKLYYDVDSHCINMEIPEFKFRTAPEKLRENLRETPLSPAKIKANPE